MDYFSELLESYGKLKKRTYKLTYITEQVGNPEAELINILKNAPEGEETPITGTNYPALEKFKYNKSKSEEGGVNVNGSLGGRPFTVQILKDGRFNDEGSAPEMKDALLKAMAGQEPEPTAADQAAQTMADQAAAREEFLATRAGQFIDQGYSTNPDDKVNIVAGMNSLQKTQEELDKYCREKDPSRVRIKWCASQKTFISGASKSSMTWKLANATRLSDPPDSREEPVPAGLVNEALKSNEILIGMLTNPPSDADREARCAELENRVGSRGKGRLVLFGEDMDTETGRPNDGLVINVTESAYLYQDAFKAADKECPDFNPIAAGEAKVNNKALNTIRGTVNEKALQLAVRLSRPGITAEERREAFSDIARYISEKQEALIEFAEGVVSMGTARPALTLDQDADETILMEQAQLAQTDGGRALARYTLEAINMHRGFVEGLGADDAYDYAKGGGTGARADSVTLFKSEDDARAAAIREGLDPDSAVTPFISDKRKKVDKDKQEILDRNGVDQMWEIGVGQKDKKDGIGAVKAGELNSTGRRSGIFRGEIKDDKIGSNFYQWMDTTQNLSDQERQEMMDFEKALEADVAKFGNAVRNGVAYTDPKTGAEKIQSSTSILTMIGKALKKALPFSDMESTDLGKAFLGKGVDFKNKEEVDKKAELLERKLRVKKVMNAIQNGSESEQMAARNWIIRNAMICGGNQRDIIQLISSYSEGKSRAVQHNAIFYMMNDPENYDVDFTSTAGGNSITINVTNKQTGEVLPSMLGFEGTNTSSGRETRTVFTLSKDAVLSDSISRDVTTSTTPKGEKNESVLYKFIESQMRLFEGFLKQAK
jgi:hypothetical protein